MKLSRIAVYSTWILRRLLIIFTTIYMSQSLPAEGIKDESRLVGSRDRTVAILEELAQAVSGRTSYKRGRWWITSEIDRLVLPERTYYLHSKLALPEERQCRFDLYGSEDYFPKLWIFDENSFSQNPVSFVYYMCNALYTCCSLECCSLAPLDADWRARHRRRYYYYYVQEANPKMFALSLLLVIGFFCATGVVVSIPRMIGLKEGQPSDGVNWLGLFRKAKKLDINVTPYR